MKIGERQQAQDGERYGHQALVRVDVARSRVRMTTNTHIALKERLLRIWPHLDERTRRLVAAAEASALGHGGATIVAEIVGLSPKVIGRGIIELDEPPLGAGNIRKRGGGRKRLVEADPTLLEDCRRILEDATRGDPMAPLLWTNKSTRRITAELGALGHKVSQSTTCDLLAQLGYSLQSNRKTEEGTSHPDRDAQFNHINETVKHFEATGQPVISVDTKKKELVGNFKNGGQEWRPAGKPLEVHDHDFPDPQLGKVIPYGVFDASRNEGWVSVGVDHDTPAFAVASIQHWWRDMGKAAYPKATELLVTADCGGSNGYRVRLWKLELQRFATETGLTVHVRHFPPGTSKWNRIEHRMFCHITQNWRGRPLISREVVVRLIGATTTVKGLKILAALDEGIYPTGVKVSDEDLDTVAIHRCEFHGEWNYAIKPTVSV
jgi:transposase